MNVLFQLLTNPALLSLIVGFFVGIYSRFQFKPLVSSAISLYLVFTIGLKGGMCLGVTDSCMPPLLILAAIGAIIGFVQPFIYARFLSTITDLDSQTVAVIASQYGSISIVTFVTAVTFLEQRMVAYDTFMSAVAGMMEIPAILSGLVLIGKTTTRTQSLTSTLFSSLYDIIASPKINFIFIGFAVGYVFRSFHNHVIPTTILWPFTIMLVLFMIDIGIKIAQQRSYIHQFTWSLIAFGIYVPIISGISALILSNLLGVDVGSSVLFAVLIASASYIAVPAVMSLQAPKAKEVIYLPLALAITLPFNVIIGIPLFYMIASWL